MTSRTLTSPLDVVKILAQVGTEESQYGFLKTFGNVYRREGVLAFWKGNGIACLRLFPYSAVQFSTYTKFKVLLMDERGRLSHVNALLAGSMGGLAATIVTYPFDMIKTRLTTQHYHPSKRKYRDIRDAFRVILREEGFLAYFRGISATVLGVVPFAGATFMAYEFLDKAWGKPKWKMTPVENFINGCAAAVFSQTFSFPFDTIRKKLQAQHNAKAMEQVVDIEFDGMIDAFRQTVKKSGLIGLYRGTVANLMKVVPYSGIMFMTFESSKRVYLYLNGYTRSPWVDDPLPNVDQSLSPRELKSHLRSL